MFKSTDTGGRIFREELYLTSSYYPKSPVNREEELDRIAQAIRPLKRRRTPENLLVYGPAGIGKTTCVKHVLDTIGEQTRVQTVWINSWQYNTRPSLLTELLIQLGYPAPRKGKPVDELLSKLREWLDKNRCVAVALDEFDQLNAKTEVVYDLHLVSQETKNKLGLVMVSNQPPSQLELDPRSLSRLNYQTLEFQPYTETQLEEILEKRVKHAFKPGAVPQETIELIAETVAENTNDCRQALELLLRAGRRAEEAEINEVTPRMVELEENDFSRRTSCSDKNNST